MAKRPLRENGHRSMERVILCWAGAMVVPPDIHLFAYAVKARRNDLVLELAYDIDYPIVCIGLW